ncbi:hypothetical protein DMC47_25655 [Nostoc sp. 3335mG]|nr:hypothetical protein DMC47_25655 [Nostoc sp. 3335mG]
MRRGALNQKYDIRRERRKLTRSLGYWYMMMFVVAPTFLLGLLDQGGAPLLLCLSLGIFLLIFWVPYLTNCGRCRTPFFFDPDSEPFRHPVTILRRPARACLKCHLDRG